MVYAFLEQKYTNLNRKYYHGQSKQQIPPHQEEYYLTTKFAYAFNYSCAYFGEVIEYNLKQIADIFNANSKKDSNVLRNFCKKYYPTFLPYIELLKTNDWSKIRNIDDKKNLIAIVKDLGYDGYFNWEIDEKVLKEYHEKDIYKWDFREGSPSIGIFNKKILIKKQVWNKNNFDQCEDFIDFKNLELEIIKEKTLNLKYEKKNNQYIIDYLRKRILAIPYEQIKEIVENITLTEAIKYHKKNLEESKDLILERHLENDLSEEDFKYLFPDKKQIRM